MPINYTLITISFFVPIIRLLFSVNLKQKINPKFFVMEWLASGLLACMIQFIGVEIVFLKLHQTTITFITALYARKIFIFADQSIKPFLATMLTKFITTNTDTNNTKE